MTDNQITPKPEVEQATTPKPEVKQATTPKDCIFVKVTKQITITSEDQLHPLMQPNDPNSLNEQGQPTKKVSDDYKPQLAWAQPVGEAPYAYNEIVICPGRVVLVYGGNERIKDKLTTSELVRCEQNGKLI